MATTVLTQKAVKLGREKVLAALNAHKSKIWWSHRDIEILAGQMAPRGKPYKSNWAPIYCASLVTDGLLIRDTNRHTWYYKLAELSKSVDSQGPHFLSR